MWDLGARYSIVKANTFQKECLGLERILGYQRLRVEAQGEL